MIGYFSTGSLASDASTFLPAFRQGMAQTGFVEGRNVAITYGWGEFQYDQLPMIAASLVHHPVVAIAAIGGTPTALVAKAATSTIPIVIYSGIDLVQSGLIASFNRPGGNITGIAALQADLIKKRIEVLHELAPRASLVALIVNPKNPYTDPEIRALQEGANSIGIRLHTRMQALRTRSAGVLEPLLRSGQAHLWLALTSISGASVSNSLRWQLTMRSLRSSHGANTSRPAVCVIWAQPCRRPQANRSLYRETSSRR